MDAERSTNDLEAGFERELANDRALLRRVGIGSWVISLSTVATFLVLIMVLQRTSPFLVALSLYAIATRLSAFVAWKAMLFPRFLVRLDDDNAAVAAAARAVFERHRTAIAQPILKDLLRSSDEAAVAALTPREAAELARAYDIEWWRRFARFWFGAWCIATLAIWTTLVVTHGGPTD